MSRWNRSLSTWTSVHPYAIEHLEAGIQLLMRGHLPARKGPAMLDAGHHITANWGSASTPLRVTTPLLLRKV